MTDWERCLKLNVLAPMALTHAFAPGMVKRKVSTLYQPASNMAGWFIALQRGFKNWSVHRMHCQCYTQSFLCNLPSYIAFFACLATMCI